MACSVRLSYSPVVAITMGDPAGIGPEISVRSVKKIAQLGICSPIIIGSVSLAERAARILRIDPRDVIPVDLPVDKELARRGCIPIFGVENIPDTNMLDAFVNGRQCDVVSGRCAIGYIETAYSLWREGFIDAIVTAPINKFAIHQAGSPFPGHTQMLASMAGVSDYAMMLVGGCIRVVLVTTHIPLRDVASALTSSEIVKKIHLFMRYAPLLGITKPKIAVAALNPHAGDSGILGCEENCIIEPAIAEASKMGYSVVGPMPSDTLFYRMYTKKEFDVAIVMYHDQGLIPLKMLYFDVGVNVTLGLPFIRTSPDHGTATDIAWQGIACENSMVEAIKLAASMARRNKSQEAR
jgi:4-hydroxythreonine-4-phosphate dehydrogenase